MKKYSNLFALLFGIVFLALGIVAEQLVLFWAFGVVPVLLSVLGYWFDCRAKKSGRKPHTDLKTGDRVSKPAPVSQPPVAPKAEKRFTCRVCGKSLPEEEMYRHDLCDACYTSDMPTKAEAQEQLRGEILESIRKQPAVQYQLDSLLWDKAAACFPEGSMHWDGAFFNLELMTGKLDVEVSTYPDQFGGSRSAYYTLTAAELHEKAMKFKMRKELRCMETEEDWAALFNDELKAAAAEAKRLMDEAEKKKWEKQRIRSAVVIPDDFADKTPEMLFEAVWVSLLQRYGSSSIEMYRDGEVYKLQRSTFLGPTETQPKTGKALTNAQAVWLEQQVTACIRNPDKSTWSSLPGGDAMSVRIIKNGKTLEDIQLGKPLKKYLELLHTLENLYNYGSFFAAEAAEQKRRLDEEQE